MNRQKEQARAAGKFKMSAALEYSGPETTFHGYETLEFKSKVLALYKEGSLVNELREGDAGTVVLDETPFYAESGGQGGRSRRAAVGGAASSRSKTRRRSRPPFSAIRACCKTGAASRSATRSTAKSIIRAQTHDAQPLATHLMHKALREVLGDHVQQKGLAGRSRQDALSTSCITSR